MLIVKNETTLTTNFPHLNGYKKIGRVTETKVHRNVAEKKYKLEQNDTIKSQFPKYVFHTIPRKIP